MIAYDLNNITININRIEHNIDKAMHALRTGHKKVAYDMLKDIKSAACVESIKTILKNYR
jgi:hypothetical protein